MTRYYADRLSGSRLRRCYEVAPPRVRQYLKREIEHVLSRLGPEDEVLELGCGYGRVALAIATHVRRVVGIDVSENSLELARQMAIGTKGCEFVNMDASALSFADRSFDAVVCVQNGICAFRVPVFQMAAEALRVTRPGGRVLFSTYSDSFWPHRLEWFELQAKAGLVGRIDGELTRRGVIVCEDGFESGTMSSLEMKALCAALGVAGAVTEVDGSSLFCEMTRP